ncbi:hypothetical protein TNCV_1586401 [Trichonephila clavipes]|nr:hypothetical protein TNCV_1586401 [Trichonephila clavipes]
MFFVEYIIINKYHRAKHSTKHHRYGLSESKPHSCTLVDNTKLSLTPHLGRSTSALTAVEWKHVVWCNESRFQLNRADARIRVWRQLHVNKGQFKLVEAM